MDELYGNETTTSQDELEVRYDKELSEAERKQASAPDKDPDRKHFRHFDYGIDTQDNVIIIEGEIQSGMTFDVISKSRLLNKLNGGDVKTFNILLNTPGGDVIETLGLIDFMRSQEKQGIKYNIIVRGAAMSAGALLLACGTGTRMASKHSKIMVHQLSTVVVGKLSDVKSNAKFSEELESDCNQLMAECTKKDKEHWESISSNDYFISSEQALELGIIDKII